MPDRQEANPTDDAHADTPWHQLPVDPGPQPKDVTLSKSLFVVLGNHLFPTAHFKPWLGVPFFMAEDVGLCTHVKHHKQKLVMFLAAMRHFRDGLRDQGGQVHYETLDNPNRPTPYTQRLKQHIEQSSRTIDTLVVFEIEDRFFEEQIQDLAEAMGLKLVTLPSPMFLTPRSMFGRYLDQASKPHMAHFYEKQRQRLNILVEDKQGKKTPTGGQWSFDADNRKKLPKDVAIPKMQTSPCDAHVEAVIDLVQTHFADHPGELSAKSWWLPVTRSQALAHLRDFLKHRFGLFGPYEDALSTRDPFLFHSVLTPALNMGLVTPQEVVDRALEAAQAHDVPINSLEGFIRQVIGWREFIRGIDRFHGEEQAKGNFFEADRGLSKRWYDGTTGIAPLDDVIHKLNRYGWCHHIERLMVAGNLMVTLGVHPRAAYRWFMEMFVDSSDWVMGPNVYGMALFADGGLFATKPYISGSNYIFKMSDYTKPKSKLKPKANTSNEASGRTESQTNLFGNDPQDALDDATWADAMDGLYWRFIDRHRTFFKTQARMSQAVATLDRMDADRKKHIFQAAEAAIDRLTTKTI